MNFAFGSGVEGRSLLRNSYSRPYRKADDLLGAFSGDWDRNGGGCCCGGGYSGGGGEASLFSDGTLLALLAAAGLAFYILYTAITAAAAARSFRKKRSVPNAERQEERVLDIEDFFFNGRLSNPYILKIQKITALCCYLSCCFFAFVSLT